MQTSFERGHPIYFDDDCGEWRYSDDDTLVDNKYPRLCPRCGEPPTKEGHDACLGTLYGVANACCGHGVEDGYTIKEGEKVKWTVEVKIMDGEQVQEIVKDFALALELLREAEFGDSGRFCSHCAQYADDGHLENCPLDHLLKKYPNGE